MKIKKDVTQLPPVSVAVVVNFSAGFLGGPLSRLLKCLTAVKVCEEYEKSGVTAVPVCYVHRDASSGFFQGEINLVDRRSKLHCVKSIGEIETLFPDGDREVLSALKEAFASDTNPVSSCAHWLRYLLKDYGVSVVEWPEIAAKRLPKAAVKINIEYIDENVREISLEYFDI